MPRLVFLLGEGTGPRCDVRGSAARGAPARIPGSAGRQSQRTARQAWGDAAPQGPTVRQAATGMGGIGKTAAAIEYPPPPPRVRHRWWIPAENPALLPERRPSWRWPRTSPPPLARPGWGWRGRWASWPGGVGW